MLTMQVNFQYKFNKQTAKAILSIVSNLVQLVDQN